MLKRLNRPDGKVHVRPGNLSITRILLILTILRIILMFIGPNAKRM